MTRRTKHVKRRLKEFVKGEYFPLVTNTAWSLVDRVMRMAAALAVSIGIARHLGPSGFGLYNYAIAFVALFGFLSYLGLSGIVTRDLARRPHRRAEILGTTFGLKTIGALMAGVLAVLTAFLQEPDPVARALVAIVAVGIRFDSSNTFVLWFDSIVKIRHAAVARIAANLLWAVLVLGSIWAGAPVHVFALLWAAQKAVQAIGLAIAYQRTTTGMQTSALPLASWQGISESVLAAYPLGGGRYRIPQD